MKRYNPQLVESKWRKNWQTADLYKGIDFAKRPKYVMLTEFPYPSGEGMHMGHIREYTLGDIIARQKRMEGFNVLYPMGYDAFGLPTENYAIKNKVSPEVATQKNIANFQEQLERLGFSFDWSRRINTSDPAYYRWTQWLFLRFFQAGLAYQQEIAVNWCPFCKTGLANEEVINGRHERCDTLVEKKLLKQWLLRITDYAQRLIDGLEQVDYLPRIADQQINWIGKSKGAEIKFKIANQPDQFIEVFTTRPDTIYGATYLAIAPEHNLISSLISPKQKSQVENYIKQAQAKSDIQRQDNQSKTGVFSGSYAINPINNQQIPIWIADYILMNYGTGAIMGVPAHDQRDFDFAKKYQIAIQYVIEPSFGQTQEKQLEREAIVAVVINRQKQQVLMLNWGARQHRSGGQLFIGGGVEPGEDLQACARREIAQECGYTNLKMINQLDYNVHNHYYSNVVDQNCYAKIRGFLFELTDDNKVDPNLDSGEKNKFSIEWVNIQDVEKLVSDPAHKYIYQALLSEQKAVVGEGIMVNSSKYDRLNSSQARELIVKDLTKQGLAREKVNYRLRDWIFSRQHYWGEPIPIIHCNKDGAVAVPDQDLPVELPKLDHYQPTGTGESPLSAVTDWVNTTCPKCGQPAKRETDTMPNWAGSSWYYLRYFDPNNNKMFASRDKLDYWGAVDLYLGGMEHVTLHLLYSRFWHQFLFDQGLVPTPEPYLARRGQGIILAADGTKMSKSKGNIVNPLEIIDSGYGADALRLAITFLAPYDQTTPWSPESLGGTFRFLQRIWTMVGEFNAADGGNQESEELVKVINKTVKRVSKDLLNLSFNTAIAGLMDCVNQLYLIKAKDRYQSVQWQWALETLLKLIAPFAPYIAEELWEQLANQGSVHISSWPTYQEKYVAEEKTVFVIQINGKVRGQVRLAIGSSQADVEKEALKDPKIASYWEANKIVKKIFVPDKLLSLVIKSE